MTDTSAKCIAAAGEQGQLLLRLSGDWTAIPQRLSDVFSPAELRNMSPRVQTVHPDMTKVTAWNSLLPAFLFRLKSQCENLGIIFDCSALPLEICRMLDMASAVPRRKDAPRTCGMVENIGRSGLSAMYSLQNILGFLGELFLAFCRWLRGKSRMRWRDMLQEMFKAGPKALGIVTLVSFLMGTILAFIGSILLKTFRAEDYVATLVGLGMFRMLGAVMVGMVMSGRTGASYAAELGTMRVNEEVDALECMGVPPMDFLVLPRVFALMLMIPFLCIFADVAGILGGLAVSVFYLDISPARYWDQLIATSGLSHFYVGVFTSWVYGGIISFWGCLRGLQCKRSSEGVGLATTSAMVSSIVTLVIATAIITVVTVVIGW